ncbi:hypothetical protein FHP25_38385 [Vineibacter terrae]|uniref:Uncharacterized protein n=1 Tax=Vineibacter terrae TaxID=2586908 RepID=A0A5C8P7I5_9HYPH|nr:PepSY domain-containing protein [Vineibacter terrae]TXL69600.1 hypothetical protein FHP25_38385 [Vineibacter terrae]
MKLTTKAALALILGAGLVASGGAWPALAQAQPAAGTPQGRTQAERDALAALKRAGYQVSELRTTKAGVIARAAKDGRELSLLVDFTGKVMALPDGR